VTNPGAIVEISDFSNGSDTISELISKYEALDATRRPSKTSTPDLSCVKIHLERSGEREEADPRVMGEISDFSNVSGTHF
jgi:hypothetical protein